MSLYENIKTFIDERKKTKLESFDKKGGDAEKRQQLESSYEYVTWLESASKRASWILYGTHIVKFTNANARGSSVTSTDLKPHDFYVSSSDVENPEIDMTGNPAGFDVDALFKVEHEGVSVLDVMKSGDTSVFETFTSKETAEEWIKGFYRAIEDLNPSTHRLAKQIYFPTDEGYLLFSPLYPSSLSQVIFDDIQNSKFSDEQKEARAARKKGEASEHITKFYPELAVMKHGGAKPLVVSFMNNRRGGRTFLFNCAPPVLRRELNASKIDNAFSFCRFEVNSEIEKLVSFYQAMPDDYTNVNIRNARDRIINRIIDGVLNKLLSLDESQVNESSIPELHKLVLLKQADSDDISAFSAEFGIWLNHKVQFLSKLTFGVAEEEHYASLMEDAIR